MIIPLYVTMSYYEALGYLFGPGRSREVFLDSELVIGRDE